MAHPKHHHPHSHSTKTTANRFPNKTTPGSITKKTASNAKSTATVSRKVAKTKPKPVTITTKAAKGPRYAIEVDFSDDGGVSFDSPLKALPNKVYQMRARFTQHQAEPLLQGVQLRWILPSGWTFVDGWGAFNYEVCISNPLHISRCVKSPSPVVKRGTRVIGNKVYP